MATTKKTATKKTIDNLKDQKVDGKKVKGGTSARPKPISGSDRRGNGGNLEPVKRSTR